MREKEGMEAGEKKEAPKLLNMQLKQLEERSNKKQSKQFSGAISANTEMI